MQVLHDLLRIRYMTLQTKAQGLCTLEQQKSCKATDAGALVPQKDCTDIGDKSGLSCGFCKLYTMIAGVFCADSRIGSAGCPIKAAGIHNDAAQGRAVSANKLCSRVDHNVGAVFNGADQIRGSKGVIYDQRQSIAVGDGCDCIAVGDIAVGLPIVSM